MKYHAAPDTNLVTIVAVHGALTQTLAVPHWSIISGGRTQFGVISVDQSSGLAEIYARRVAVLLERHGLTDDDHLTVT